MTDSTPKEDRRSSARRGVLPAVLLLFFALVLTRFIRYARASLVAVGPTTGRDQFIGAALDPSKLIAAAILLLLIAALLTRPKQRLLRIDLPGKALFAFGILCFISVAWAYDPRHTIMWSIRMMQWVFLYIALISVTRTERDLSRWAHLFLLASVLNMIAIIQERVAPATGFGGFAGKEVGATYLVLYPRWAIVFLAFALHSAVQGKSRTEKVAGILAVVANLTTIYLSQRRGGPPAVALVFFVYLIATGWRDRRFIAVMAVLTVAFVVTIMLDPSYSRRLSTIPFIGQVDLSYWEDNQRMVNYLVGIELFRAHPILGAGLGSTYVWSVDHFPVRLVQHSLLLNLLSEVGLVGFSFYALFIYATLKRMIRTIRGTRAAGNKFRESYASAALSSLVAMLFWAQLQPSLSALEIYLCCALGSVAASVFLHKHAGSEDDDAETVPLQSEERQSSL